MVTRLLTNRKPRVLLLAYYFPPISTIGSVRGYNLAKWLTRKGWQVTVVTPAEPVWGSADDGTDLHEELSREGIRCIRTNHRWRSLLPGQTGRRRHFIPWIAGGMSRRLAAFFGIEREVGWIAEAAQACAGLTSDDVDIILASGPPFGSFGLARQLSDRLGCPFVIDYRDLWSANPFARRSVQSTVISRERAVLAASAAVVGISPGLVESLGNRFGVVQKLHVITNGFDPEELSRIPNSSFGHFAIVYTGQFYPPKSTVEPLLRALKQIDEGDGAKSQWVFHYYGYHGEYVRRVARGIGLEHRVILNGRVSRPEALAAVRGANLAVVVSSVYGEGSLQDRGVVTGKVFEAIGLGTPLLVIAPEGSDLEGILAVTGGGKRFAGTELNRIAEYLKNAMDGETAPRRNPEPFSWVNIADQLDSLLRKILSGSIEAV